MATRLIVASSIYAAILTLCIATSGVPIRVHMVEALALAVGFWMPALVLDKPRSLRDRWAIVSVFVLAGLILYDLLSAQVIVKRDFLMLAWFFYPLGICAMLTILIVHSWITGAIRKRAT